MHTPFFPALRPRLAALGKRVQHLRQQSLAHLEQLVGSWLPPGLLSQSEEGPNSRDRIYSLRRTFFAFLYQVLNPDCPCRELVRQVQALFGLQGQGPVDQGTDRKSTRLNSSHVAISYAVFCLKKKKKNK